MKNSVSTIGTPDLPNALPYPQIPPDAKHKFVVTCLNALFVESVSV
jgi:hypothetical protein